MAETKTEAAPVEGMDFSLIRAFVAEQVRIKEAEKQLKADKAELESTKQLILDGFGLEGVGSIRIDEKTVYTHRQLWGGKADLLDNAGEPVLDEKTHKPLKVENDDYIAAIKAAGLDHLVKEPELKDIVSVTEKFDVRVRKA